MFSGLRLRLTLLYALAALVFVLLIGSGAYLLVARYFSNVTDLALRHKMAHEFHALGAPLPPDLEHADRDWSIIRREVVAIPFVPPEPTRERREREETAYEEDDERPRSLTTPVDAAELAAIAVLPLDASGRLLFNPNNLDLPLNPDQEAFQTALAKGSDLRTITLDDGRRARLLTYRLTRSDGPAALQLVRELSDQDQVLNQLFVGLITLGTFSMALVGATSWWLAGRALRPAQEAWERQQRFIASASHELRAPLTLIRASAEVALRDLPPDESDQRALLHDVLAESDHMRRLVDDLLTLTRLDSGQLTLTKETVDLTALLASIQRQAARLGEQRGVAVELADVGGLMQADAERLQQVVLIALDNALRHTPSGGRITLAATPADRMVQITVADTGSGIAPEHLPHIFDRFYRADPARGRENGNAGLGLSIAKGLVEAMGGRIAVESTVGVGTTVVISLPRAPDRKPAESPEHIPG
ncbi:sensor histidine kinase [Roseiflexus sp. RS-1]|uniref:sensor histidine kinase n=1 Tax=Roseiflexus sp. (strain RS-1) TaxID=357808 RepID=UPI0000D816F0|nr:HAMP domain-containing sensor histidine kinase [Roseiflexus sp. RS-1]ABQ89035.1 integral membrane sensor signal transduction histidine kinase [Roseiflexus sp. RS-1]